jgi:hypothetical protein
VKFNRLTFGILAAVVAAAATAVVALMMGAGGGRRSAKFLLMVFAGVAGAVMWAGEASGLMREAFEPSSEPVLGLDKRRSS